MMRHPIQYARYRRQFLNNRDRNLFMGSFESLEAARASVPSAMPVGYEQADGPKTMYSPQIEPWDYPALFWLEKSMASGMRGILDLGGHVGIKYYAFRRAIAYPPDLRWRVCDVPRVVQAGRELAMQRQATDQLSFCTDYRTVEDFEVLYVSGALQYLPVHLGEILASLHHRPARIILNTTAVHPVRTLYTVNSIGVAFCPYRIQHADELADELRTAGYKRVDGWRNEGKPILVPFVEDGDQAYYMGGCFESR